MRGISLAKACQLANIKYSTLHSQISNERAIPFTTIDNFCAALNLPIRLFSQSKLSIALDPVDSASTLMVLTPSQATEIAGLSNEINTDDVLDWLVAHDNRLVNHEWLIDRIDLFHPLKMGDTVIRPYRIGRQSLASVFFRLSGIEDYNNAMADYDQNVVQQIIQSHVDAATNTYAISEQIINQKIGGTRITGAYRRLIAPVTDADGQKLTMVFSKLTQFSRR